jgi:predicted RNA-binding Zn-ribbon protein involved in translation (DUF1610 family)
MFGLPDRGSRSAASDEVAAAGSRSDGSGWPDLSGPGAAASGVASEAVSTAAPADLSVTADSFRVRCPDCGPQVIPITDVRYVETGDDASTNRYMFACPECGVRVRRPAGPEISEILRSSGVATLALHRGSGEAV